MDYGFQKAHFLEEPTSLPIKPRQSSWEETNLAPRSVSRYMSLIPAIRQLRLAVTDPLAQTLLALGVAIPRALPILGLGVEFEGGKVGDVGQRALMVVDPAVGVEQVAALGHPTDPFVGGELGRGCHAVVGAAVRLGWVGRSGSWIGCGDGSGPVGIAAAEIETGTSAGGGGGGGGAATTAAGTSSSSPWSAVHVGN